MPISPGMSARSRRKTYSRRLRRGGAVGGLAAGFEVWVNELLAEAAARGFPARVTSGYRSSASQGRLCRRWLRGMAPFPAAPPGHSMHERGRAVDLGGLSESELQALGAWWESTGGRWGGRFGDPIHFER